MKNFLVASTITAMVITGTCAVAGPGPGDPGTVAADFSLQEFGSGNFHTLSEHHGEVVLLFVIGYG